MSQTNLEGGGHTHNVEFLLTHSLSWNKQHRQRGIRSAFTLNTGNKNPNVAASAVFIKQLTCNDKAEEWLFDETRHALHLKLTHEDFQNTHTPKQTELKH